MPQPVISPPRACLFAALAVCLLAAACSTATAAGLPGVSAQSTSDPSSDAAPGVATAADASASQAPDAAGAIRVALDPSASQASYHAHEQLVGQSLPNEAVGTTHGVSGSVVLNADGSVAADQSQVTIDLSTLQSDESRRDDFIKSNTLQTNQYPTATFVPTQVQGLAWPVPSSGQASFQVLGTLTVHDVSRPVVWQVNATFDGASISGDATTTVNISDFGMQPPKAGPVLSIEDPVTLELAFSATSQA